MDPTRISPIEVLILRLLIGSPAEMYGLELVNSSEGKLKRGTVYVTLGRMEDKGLITSRPESQADAAGRLPRRLYKPTGLGERALRAQEMAQQIMTGNLLPGVP